MCSGVNIFWVDGGGGGGSWVECPGSKGGRLCPAPGLEPPPWRRGGAPLVFIHGSPATGYMAARPFHSLCPQSCGFVYSQPEGDRSGATHFQFSSKWCRDPRDCRAEVVGFNGAARPDKRLKRDHLPPGSTVACAALGSKYVSILPPTNCPLWVELWSF